MNRKNLIPALLLTLALAGTRSVSAQELTAEESSRLAGFEAGLSSASPVAARGLAADAGLLGKLARLQPDRAAGLKAKASAITDFEKLVDKDWPADQMRNLSSSLALRLTPEGALAQVGLAPEPENTLDWAARFKTYSAEKTLLLGRAVKKWDVIFNKFTFTSMRNASGAFWIVRDPSGKYFTDINENDFIFRDTVAEMNAFWGDLTLKERNDFLAGKAAGMLTGFFIEGSTRTDAAFQQVVSGYSTFEYLDASGKGLLDRYLSQMKAAEEVKANLSASQLASLEDQPVEQQMYLLGNMFDKSGVKGGAALERRVDVNRPSRPGETLSPQTNALLGDMLRTSLTSEIRGTAAGDKVAAFYRSGAKLSIAIESCQGCHAKYEPSTGRIIIDSELIQQYARANNLSAEDLLKKGNLANLSKYISPIFVHEATHQMQHSWAARAGIYKPYTQEDEIEANSMEALYTSQKRDSDLKFRSIFLAMRQASVYAQQRMELSRRFEGNQKEFGEIIRQQYYFGVPSFEAASSQILSAISAELDRRKSLGAAELAEIENTGKDLAAAQQMSPQKIAESVGEIKTPALRKIQDDLLRRRVYTQHYAGAERWAASALRAGSSAPIQAVPAP